MFGALLAASCRIDYDELSPIVRGSTGGSASSSGGASSSGSGGSAAAAGAGGVNTGGSAGTSTSSAGAGGDPSVGGAPGSAGTPGLGGGTPVTFGAQPDSDHQGTFDTFIIESAPTQNRATSGVFILSGETSNRQVGLLYFDLTPLAAGTTISGAVLSLRTPADEFADGDVNVYQMLESWVDVEATWNERASGTAWTAPGADVGSRSDVILATFTASAQFTTYDIPLPAALIQGWVDDPSSNFGVALVATGTDIGQLFASSSGTGENRPLLSVSVP